MQTALYSRHLQLNAKMVDFAGWLMPIYYKGILLEHQTVRERVGIFDVSHMGKIEIFGPDAELFLNYLSTNYIVDKDSYTATYTVWCDSSGKAIDDVIVYRQSLTSFFVVVNASNRQKDLNHLRHLAINFKVAIQPQFEDCGMIALQGPLAIDLIDALFPSVKHLKPMTWIEIREYKSLIISRTGYTGAGGFEFYGSNQEIVVLWDQLLEAGNHLGIEPIGLGARDTLRLEMGFALYGHEISEKIAPIESVSAWSVKWNKGDFLGKNALKELEQSSQKRFAYGVKLKEPGIAREGYPVFKDQKQIGVVTSGSMSPTLNEAIALILVNQSLEMGALVNIQIRQTQCLAEIVSLPFIRKNK
jgi:aminomethyltransferase